MRAYRGILGRRAAELEPQGSKPGGRKARSLKEEKDVECQHAAFFRSMHPRVHAAHPRSPVARGPWEGVGPSSRWCRREAWRRGQVGPTAGLLGEPKPLVSRLIRLRAVSVPGLKRTRAGLHRFRQEADLAFRAQRLSYTLVGKYGGGKVPHRRPLQ